MSMPALLSHFGLGSERFVTQSGRIIFDGVHTDDRGDLAHPEFGAVTQVANHTFHGGTEPTDSLSASAWWDDEFQISRHIEAMQSAFPTFKYLPAEEGLVPAWIGQIDTGRGRFCVLIRMRRDRGLPFVSVVSGPRLGATAAGRWIPSPHLYLNGNLCIADQKDWDPDKHTVVTAMAWTAHWLAAFTEWRIGRQWPVEGVAVLEA